ncbi:MAG: hypothetical protein ABI969_02605 [bacterium]
MALEAAVVTGAPVAWSSNMDDLIRHVATPPTHRHLMNAILLATIPDGANTVVAMCCAGIVLLLIGLYSARREIIEARGLDKIVALKSVAIAAPLAVFGALHLFGPKFVMPLVPPYMPFRMFWVYGVGVALIAAALSIATGKAVRWSGVGVGLTMFGFVAMIHFPGALRHPEMRKLWVICSRELSFGGAGWILAGVAWGGANDRLKGILIMVGRALITIAIVFYGVQHFLHPTLLPGVPLEKEIPTSIPARQVIDYVTGVALLLAGGSVLFSKNTRAVVAALGAWLLALVLVLYGPLMISALFNPAMGEQLVGVNYFADTLLFAGAILALASVAPRERITLR